MSFVIWGAGTRYHSINLRVARSVRHDTGTGKLVVTTTGGKLVTLCGRDVPEDHRVAAHLSLHDLNNSRCETCRQAG